MEVTAQAQAQTRQVSPAPAEYYLLNRQLEDREIATVVTLRGLAFVRGAWRPFLVWAASGQRRVQERNSCVEEWQALQVFIGDGPDDLSNAPWGANDGEFSICYVAGEPHFRVRAEPSLDEWRWGELIWSGGALYEQSSAVALDVDGHLPSEVLPPVLRPRRLSYDGDDVPPVGYVHKEKRLWGVSTGGALVFTLAYGVPLIAAASSASDATGKWAIPIAGPLLVWGDFLGSFDGPCGDFCFPRGVLIGGVTMLLWVDALAQGLGLGGVVAGGFLKKHWWERVDPATHAVWSVQSLPVVAGSGFELRVKY